MLCAQALVFICLAPSFPGTLTRGGRFVISEPFNTEGGREATGILIRGRARGWGGAPQSPLGLRGSCGGWIFAFGPRRQRSCSLITARKKDFRSHTPSAESLFEVAVISFGGSDSSHTGLLTTTLGCISQTVYLGRDSRKETAQSQAPLETLLTLK